MSQIIRGYWDCEYCNTIKIDGLVDTCPNCGKQKSDNVKYYMGSPNDIVTEEELLAANISAEECDGEHPEWICPYCEQLNDYADTVCIACGGNKKESTENYQNFETNRYKDGDLKQSGIKDLNGSIDDITETISTLNECVPDLNEKHSEEDTWFNKIFHIFGVYAPAIFSVLVLFLLFILFVPFKHEVVVSDFSWNRIVTVEEYKTVEEDGWSLPSGARLIEAKEEYHSSKQVLDHYETKTRQASRMVQDGYDTYTTYEDNGNGTFRSVEHKTPRYKTEYYTETYQDPVYRTEPVYKTKYYYEIDKWLEVDDYATSGQGKEPYWSTEYTLEDNERDTSRDENYYIHYTDEDDSVFKNNVPYEKWENAEIGDKEIVYKSLIGITY